MAHTSMDPYEAQLYAVFATFADSSGNLDQSSLTKLCAALQMESGSTDELVAMSRRSGQRITFSRFRDSLVKVLGGGGDGKLASASLGLSDEESGRELSPKFVYGAKKYGRRSRPRDISNTTKSTKETTSKDADSDSSLVEKSRRSLYEIKSEINKSASQVDTMISTDEALSKSTDDNQVELDHNKTVDCDEAIVICRSMRMGNIDIDLIKELFQEGELDVAGRLTVGEFFHRLNKKLINSITVENDNISPVSSENRVGRSNWRELSLIEHEVVVEMWERAGISHCRQLLHDLGFTGERINLTELTVSLDEEIKSLLGDVNKVSGTNIPSLFLQASLCLHRHELRCIREMMDQVFAENSKMKTDLNEANQRAQMLAQEVDENHAKMENSLKNKMKQLELKHAEIMRTVEEERSHEREISNSELSNLKDKLATLESEESKLRNHCATLQQSNEELERKLTHSEEHARELEQVRTHLTREIKSLQSEREDFNPSHGQQNQVEKLATLVSDFRMENKALRDRNDELSAELEDMQQKLTRENRRLSLGRSKPQCSVDITSEQAMSLLEECEAGWDGRRDGPNAIKRRGDSPSKGQYALFEGESPRIGKLRRCHEGMESEEPSKGDTSVEWDLDSCSDSGSLPLNPAIQFIGHGQEPNENEQKNKMSSFRLDSKTVKIIENTLEKFNVNLHSTNCESCNTLKDILSMIHKKIEFSKESEHNEKNKTFDAVATQTECTSDANDKVSTEETENVITKLKEEKDKLSIMCRDLETSLDQLKSEYDKCEEYWANKLDEEREIFNEEQKISDEKFQDLLSKISDYEEQFSPNSKIGSKLPTIEEKYSLEMQFTDLEEEFHLYREKKSVEIENKVKEINALKEEIRRLENVKNFSGNRNILDSNGNNNSNIDEVDNSIPEASSPIDYLWNQSTINSPMKNGIQKRDFTRDYQNPAFTKSSSNPGNCDDNIRSSSDNGNEPSVVHPIKKPSAPKRSNSAELLNNPSTEGGNRAFGAWSERGWGGGGQGIGGRGGMIQCSELEGQLRKNAQPTQSDRSGWTTNGEAGAACLLLEQRCRQLHLALRQHQICLDTVQQNARSESAILRQKLYSAEAAIGKLQERLTSADLLVKELYVENCQLAAFKPHLL